MLICFYLFIKRYLSERCVSIEYSPDDINDLKVRTVNDIILNRKEVFTGWYKNRDK